MVLDGKSSQEYLVNDLQDTEDWGSNWHVDLNAGKTLLVLFGWSNSWCY